jgi:hypothetical protein
MLTTRSETRTMLESVVHEFHEYRELPLSAARAEFEELLKFLTVCATTRARLSPSRMVDSAWHFFLSKPATYNNFCRTEFGRIISHVPCEPNLERYLLARQLIRDRFGELNEQMWPDVAPDVEATDIVADCSGPSPHSTA